MTGGRMRADQVIERLTQPLSGYFADSTAPEVTRSQAVGFACPAGTVRPVVVASIVSPHHGVTVC
jgi:hypothetical protein